MVRNWKRALMLSLSVGLSAGTVTAQPAESHRPLLDSGPRRLWLRSLDASLQAADILPEPIQPGALGDGSGEGEGEKSRGGAFLRSLVIPGWGQRYAQSRKASIFFFANELLLWGGYVFEQTYGGWLRDDYRLFAATHAGIDPQGKPSSFFVDVGNYASLDDYNNAQLRRRSVSALYPREKGYEWQWDNDANRRNYRRLRVRSDEAFNAAVFFIGGVFANHLISAVHSVWAVHRYNRRYASRGEGLRWGIETRTTAPAVLLTVSRRF